MVGLEIYDAEFLGFERIKMMDYYCDDTFNFEYKAINCSYNKLKSIPEKIFRLEYLNFTNNDVGGDVVLHMYPNLKYLMASSNKIKTISNLQDNLEYLDLLNNFIDELFF